MTQALPPAQLILSASATGLLGLALGWAGARRFRKAESEREHQLEALARAREASDLVNAELRRALDQMEHAAATDRLTGAWNRRWFEDGAAQFLAVSDREDAPISLILFDLDHFKEVNDTYGHEAGDAVLKAVTQAVRGELRASDALARWGGEEFIALCPATALAGATILAEKVRRAVEARVMPQAGTVTISLGVAQRQASEPLEAWIRRADEALYRAKAQGRNQVQTSLDLGGAAEDGQPAILVLTWDPSLASGNTRIDHQHQELYRLSNGLLAAITNGRYPEEARLRMQLLIAHVVQHFHDEEVILARVGYADLADHAREHARLVAKAKDLQRGMGGDSTDLPAILSFLALDLVKGHIMAWDRRFFGCLAQD